MGPGGSAITDWHVWWSFNRDLYLQLKRAIHKTDSETGYDDFFLGFGQSERIRESRPDDGDLQRRIVPELIQALDGSKNQDLVTACLMALAKIGLEPLEGPGLVGLIGGHLAHSNQEIAETAAVALGILGDESSATVLVELLIDSEAGRRRVNRAAVPYRTRAFAAYGLALIGSASERSDVRSFVVFHLANTLQHESTATRDLATACVISLGLVPLEVVGEWPTADDGPPRVNGSREAQVAWLLHWFSTSRAKDQVRLHAPVAMARLCSGAGPAAKRAVGNVLLTVLANFGKEDPNVRRATVTALGRLGDDDADDLDTRIRGKLRKIAQEKDAMSRDLARISLARVATRPGTGPEPGSALDPVQRYFIKDLITGKSTTRPWTALALGVLAYRRQETGLAVAREVPFSLRQALAGTKSPRDVGAISTALGLARDADAAPLLVQRLRGGADDVVKSRAAIALGLVHSADAAQELRTVARESLRKPNLLRAVSTALALLGDHEILPELIVALREAKTFATQSALAFSIGRIGDTRAVTPLLELLRNENVSISTRAFAAAALGVVGDDRELPWNSMIAVDVYYGIPPSTLTDGARGVLDLL